MYLWDLSELSNFSIRTKGFEDPERDPGDDGDDNSCDLLQVYVGQALKLVVRSTCIEWQTYNTAEWLTLSWTLML